LRKRNFYIILSKGFFKAYVQFMYCEHPV